MGARGGMEERLVPKYGYRTAWIRARAARGKGLLQKLLLPANLLFSFWESARYIRSVKPSVVLGLGGYVAFPGGMMAALRGTPLVVHEPGAVAGITNRVLAPVADRVVVGMEGAFDRPVAQRWANALPRPARVDWLGTPVREEITAVPEPGKRFADRAGRLRLLVVGGSLGAQTMNDLVLAAVASMAPAERPEIVHQAGEKLYEGLRAGYAGAGVEAEVLPFVNDMAARYAWCDVLICRSGAITVAEIGAAGIAAILFPLPWFVADEQAANAAFLAGRDAGIALKQLETQPHQLAELLRGLDRTRLAQMARNARALGKPDATRRCADLCVELSHAT
jgi:UDP-N-acetylglucosamine--N-acetylmuramyl-(pentapeptide) pyrophosphoryl-undecaprenol N-acetylglucosamine transferase